MGMSTSRGSIDSGDSKEFGPKTSGVPKSCCDDGSHQGGEKATFSVGEAIPGKGKGWGK